MSWGYPYLNQAKGALPGLTGLVYNLCQRSFSLIMSVFTNTKKEWSL